MDEAYSIARCSGMYPKEDLCLTCRRTELGEHLQPWRIDAMVADEVCFNYIPPKTKEEF